MTKNPAGGVSSIILGKVVPVLSVNVVPESTCTQTLTTYRFMLPDFLTWLSFISLIRKPILLLYTMKIWFRNMPPANFPLPRERFNLNFQKHSTSLRKRKANHKIMIPQRPLYFCKGLSLGNYMCKIETFPINTNCSHIKKNCFNHSRLT